MASLSQNNPLLAGLIVYAIFTTIFIGAYTSDVQASYATNTTMLQESMNSSQTFSSNAGSLGWFQALWIVGTDLIPWWITLLFIVLPDAMLGIIIYDKLRGI